MGAGRAVMRAGWLVTATALVGCAGAGGSQAMVFATLPPGPAGGPWMQGVVATAPRPLFEALSTRGAAALIDLRIHGDELAGLYNPAGMQRAGRVLAGLTPRASERRWAALRSFAGTPIVGWCARGVRVGEPDGVEGFRGRVLTVDRLLVVGREPDGLWAMWLEGLAYTAAGWRFLPTVSYGEAVQAPRRDHADVDLWDCDLGVRP